LFFEKIIFELRMNMKNSLLLLNQQFFSVKNEYNLAAERRATARRSAVIHLKNPD